MNQQHEINFSEARETLEKLTNYINQKIQRRNSSGASELNLASQPEVVSDHLGEEIPLTPVGSAQQNQMPSTEAVGMSATSIPAVNGISTIENQSANEITEMSVKESSFEQGSSVAMASVQDTNQQLGQFNVPSVQENSSISSVPAGEVSALDTNQPATQINNANFQNAELTPDTYEAPSTGEKTSELESIPNIDLSGVLNQSNGELETISAPQLNGMSSDNSQKNDEGYKAIMNNATIGYPAETPPETTPVVMPNGMTQDMASDTSVVVGPEAFNMTR